MTSSRYNAEPLFQPLSVRDVRLPNRIVMSAMTRSMSPGGVPTDEVAGYYRRRVEGDIGLILTEGVGVDHPLAVDNPNIPVMYGTDALAGWSKVVKAVHDAGGVIFPQLWHQGPLRDARLSDVAKHEPGSRPSGLFGPIGMHSLEAAYLEGIQAPTRPMTEEEVQDVIDAFGRSAAHAKAVGFDGIALHGGHGYLLDAFLWEGTNKRTDRFGGDAVGRTTFLAELVRTVRRAVGERLPILLRFSQHKQQDYKARLADTPAGLERVLGPLADAGVDIFDASTRQFDLATFEGSDLNLAGWAKKLTGRLAMTVGGIGLNNALHDTLQNAVSKALNGNTDTQVADNIGRLMARFNKGEFDLVAVGRSVLVDPNWAKKLRQGEPFLPFDRSAFQRLT